MSLSNKSLSSVPPLFPKVTPLNVQKTTVSAEQLPKAVLGLYSRECSPELLGRLVGSNCFVERPLAPEIIEAADQGHNLLYITAPDLPDKEYVVDYYIRLKPRSPQEIQQIQQQIVVLALDNHEPLWLSQKLAAPAAKEARDFIANWISQRHQRGERVELHTFEPSAMTEAFAAELGLEPDQAPSTTLAIGSKSGSKQIFDACGIDQPRGTPECRNLDDFTKEIAYLLQQKPEAKKLILKLSSTLYGAGQGNALFDVSSIDRSHPETILQQVQTTLVEENVEVIDKKLGWQGFVAEIPKAGIIAELFIEGEYKETPSAQGSVDKDGTVRLVSVHEQRFAANKQTYIGSFYHADDAYRHRVGDLFKLIAAQSYTQGHVGAISVDFLCVRHSENEDWRILPMEINNRLTGTAHAFRIVTSLLGVRPNEASPKLQVNGETRVYLASDSIYKPEYAILRPAAVIDTVRASNVHYDSDRHKGAVLYMLSGLSYGKCGAVVIGSTEDECLAMQADIYKVLDDLVSTSTSQQA